MPRRWSLLTWVAVAALGSAARGEDAPPVAAPPGPDVHEGPRDPGPASGALRHRSLRHGVTGPRGWERSVSEDVAAWIACRVGKDGTWGPGELERPGAASDGVPPSAGPRPPATAVVGRRAGTTALAVLAFLSVGTTHRGADFESPERLAGRAVADGESGRGDDLSWDETPPSRVRSGSDAWVALAARSPAIADWLRLGDRMLVVIDGRPLEVVPDERRPTK